MAAIVVNEFSECKLGDATNALQVITSYMNKITLPTDSQAVDVTTLVAGGGQMTDNMVRGEKQATVTIEGPGSDSILYYLNQVMAARGGSTLQYAQGNNAPPAPGDMCWRGTLTIFQVDITYNVGSGAWTWKATLRPSDPGAVSGSYINPGYYPY